MGRQRECNDGMRGNESNAEGGDDHEGAGFRIHMAVRVVFLAVFGLTSDMPYF